MSDDWIGKSIVVSNTTLKMEGRGFRADNAAAYAERLNREITIEGYKFEVEEFRDSPPGLEDLRSIKVLDAQGSLVGYI